MMRELLYGARPNTGLGLHSATYDPSCQDALTLENVVLHYVLWEIPTRVGMDNLPPSLHPTWPGLLVLQSWRVPDSPVGPFAFASVALTSRTSIKPRQYVLSAWSDTTPARNLLSARYGYPVQIADVRQLERIGAATTTIDDGDRRVLEVTTGAMRTISGTSAALKLSPQLSAANVLGEPGLLQTEFGYAFKHTRRGKPRITAFDAQALGLMGPARLSDPVAGSVAELDITLNPARFALDPERPAEQIKSRRLDTVASA